MQITRKIRSVKCFVLLALTTLLLSTSSCSALKMTSSKSKLPEASIEKEGINIYRDIRYGDIPEGIGEDISSDRILDIYKPINNVNKKLPVFIFIHGGGFAGGDKMNKGNEALCLKMASHGFAVVSINYYLTLRHKKSPGANCATNMSKGLPTSKGFHPKLQEAIKNASDDTQLALAWIKDNAKQYKLDPSAVVVSGGSAGAMTALYTAYVSNQKILPIKAVINMWGGLENSHLIKKNAPPLLTYHGDQDDLINPDYAYALQNQMKKLDNIQSETHILEDMGHALYTFITQQKTGEITAFFKKVMKSDE